MAVRGEGVENMTKEEEEDLDEIMGEVNKRSIDNIQSDIPPHASSAPPPPPPESPPRLNINFVIIIA